MKTFTLAALLAAVLAGSPAYAQPAPQRVAVSLAGLDLASAEGRQAAELRLFHAARTACGTPSPADPHGRAAQDECVAEARDAAIGQLAIALASVQPRGQAVLASGR